MGPTVAVAGGGLGTLLLVLLVLFLGGDPNELLRNLPQNPPAGGGAGNPDRPLTPEEERLGDFARAIFGSTEDVWSQILPDQKGIPYQPPTLVLFSGQVQSACGFTSSAVGPFYCPGDQKVYIDLNFYEELSDRLGAPGDFAQAYVLAHEVGHHIQNLLGITDEVHRQQGRISQEEFNALSVRLELQADFLAGVWAHHAEQMQSILERGDVEEAMNAADAIGDDNLQRQAQGYVVPDSFTHGTSAQRVRWFRQGLETGDINQGDTFRARSL